MRRAVLASLLSLALSACPHDFTRGEADAGLDSRADAAADGPRDGDPRDAFPVPEAGCPSGFTACGALCFDLLASNDHCGACDQHCAAGLDCASGSCACVGGGSCAGCCADSTTCVPFAGQDTTSCGLAGAPCEGCDDGKSCSDDRCSSGACEHLPKTGFCLIDGSCYPDGATNTTCYRCVPSQSADAWTILPNPGCVVTFAGSGVTGWADKVGEQAMFDGPIDVALSGDGATLYIADTNNSLIRAIDLASRKVTTVAGSGGSGFVDGDALNATFHAPWGIGVDSAGAIYVADTSSYTIRKIAAGQVITIAGIPFDSFYEDGDAALARFSEPTDVAVDDAGMVFVVDSFAGRIRTIGGGQVSTYAGSGSRAAVDGPLGQAGFHLPLHLALDSARDKLYVADTVNDAIREIHAGLVTTIAGVLDSAGFVNGAAAQARFHMPRGIAVGADGAVYVGDRENHAIRKITRAPDVVTTLAGGPTKWGFLDGPASQAQFLYPSGVAVDSKGVVYVADSGNNRIPRDYP